MTKVIIFSHTHWDREWYFSFRQFQYLLGQVMDEVIVTLQEDKKFTAFVADGQTCIINDYLEVRPSQADTLKTLIKEGRIVIGPWYTMPDLWLSGGEALVRNLFYGMKDCLAYGTLQPKIGYVPDSFGHIEQMPAILNGFGIDNYIFTRGLPNEDIGEDIEFYWIGLDGKSRVTAHILPQNYGSARMLEPTTNPEGLKRQLEFLVSPYHTRSFNKNLVLGCGGTDHIRIQKDLPEILKMANDLMPDYEFTIGKIDDYIKEFDKNKYPLRERYGTLLGKHKTADMLHGTWSSRVDNKIENYCSSAKLLNYAEPINALMNKYLGLSHSNELELAWRLLLQNHAHDSICGCSMDRVHSDVTRRFAHIEEICDMLVSDGLSRFNSQAIYEKSPYMLRFSGLNGSLGCGEFLVDFHKDTDFHLEDINGNLIPVQIIDKKQLMRQDVVRIEGKYQNPQNTKKYFTQYHAVAKLPDGKPCSIEHYKIVEGAVSLSNTVFAINNTMENKLLKITVQPDATIEVYDKFEKRLHKGLLQIIDDSETGGGYEHHSITNDIPITKIQDLSITVLESCGVRAKILLRYVLPLPKELNHKRTARTNEFTDCIVETTLSIDEDSNIIRCKTKFNNTAKEHRVRIVISDKSDKTNVVCGRPFAATNEDLSIYTYDEGQNQNNMFDWLAFDGIGFMGKGLHEFSLEDKQIKVTLLRAVPFTYESGTWQTPDAQLLKELTFSYNLIFYGENWQNSCLPKTVATLSADMICEVHGAAVPKWLYTPYASNYMGEVIDGEVYPISMDRRVRDGVYCHRDGWRRRDKQSLPHYMKNTNIIPFIINDNDIIVTCFKTTDDSSGMLLRFYSTAKSKKDISIDILFENNGIYLSNLMEQRITLIKGSITTLPFEIKTIIINN